MNAIPKPRLHIILFAVLAVFLLTGCQTTLTTKVQASGDQAAGSFSLVLENEAADALKADPATDQQLLQTIADRTSSTVTREVSDNTITYRSGVPADKSLVDISGVAIDQVERIADDVKVSFQIVQPKTLVEALRKATEGDSDSDARLLVLQRTTFVCAEVYFAGGVKSVVEKGPVQTTRDGNSVKACGSIESLSQSDASLSVIGDPKRNLTPYLISGLALVVLLTIGYRRWLKR
jgi:hypothetical protein